MSIHRRTLSIPLRTLSIPCRTRSSGLALAAALVLAAAPLAAPAAAGAGTPFSAIPSMSRGGPPDRGPVDVLYAGSLTHLMEQTLGPRFTAATGYRFSGFAGGSKDLANAIEGKVRRGDVFVSASPKVDDGLRGTAGGDWVSWYADFASSSLVLGYDPHSHFASQLRTLPWYQVVNRPGFLLGRTDPALDPKGALAARAVQDTARSARDPALLEVLQGTAGVYPEETLVGRLQAGQLDAGFFYASEAKAAGIPTVSLRTVKLSATYTVTVLNGAPHAPGADAFVGYLFTKGARTLLMGGGLNLISPPKLQGTGVPKGLRTALHAR